MLAEKIIKRVNKFLFDRASKGVLNTPQCNLTSNTDYQIVIVSQVYSAAVMMTLLALKSFILNLKIKVRLDLIDDGSLTETDKEIYKQHFSEVNIIPMDSVELNGCPQGGCWERLCYILKVAKTDYVIQVDTDTLTINNLSEIEECIANNTAFVISGPKWLSPIPAVEMAKTAQSWKNPHVQSSAESLFDELESIDLIEYCRGCAAFASFPKGIDMMPELSKFSKEMEQKLGASKWNEWGSEQLSSNVIISLTDKPSILPWPKYQNYGFPFDDNLDITEFSVIHFVGSHRYDKGTYKRLAKKVITNLSV
ncbi:hypothetical protein [Glaciecola sp. MF2-115]|uniref:hypothetical protein n=1 Tax=Glaciecola sp. MF2-115 TaxID=3384827 RepID=UPI00399FC5CA